MMSADPPSLRPEGRFAEADRYLGLDYLRLILALMVVAYHYSFFGPLRGRIPDDYFGGMLPYFGQFGVQGFFIISGFVIAISAEGKSGLAFLASRIARLYPALAAGTLLTFATAYFVAPEPGQVSWAAAVHSLSLVGMLIDDNFVRFVDDSYWSLTYELWFYVVTLVLIIAGQLARLALVLAVLGILTLTLVLLNILPLRFPYLLSPHVGYFGLGVVLSLVWRHGVTAHRLLMGALFFGLATSGTSFSQLQFAEAAGLSSTVRWFTATLITSFSLGAIVIALRLGKDRSNAPLALTAGGLSYPLYLIHQEAGYVLLARLHPVVGLWASLAATIAVALAVSWLIWIGVERRSAPILKRLILRLAK